MSSLVPRPYPVSGASVSLTTVHGFAAPCILVDANQRTENRVRIGNEVSIDELEASG